MLDLTDHVWSEIWIPELNRYVHIDPCERAFDTPLMYESGWNKKLTHVISFSRCSVVNATPRYTRTLAQLILRRSADADTRYTLYTHASRLYPITPLQNHFSNPPLLLPETPNFPLSITLTSKKLLLEKWSLKKWGRHYHSSHRFQYCSESCL